VIEFTSAAERINYAAQLIAHPERRGDSILSSFKYVARACMSAHNLRAIKKMKNCTCYMEAPELTQVAIDVISQYFSSLVAKSYSRCSHDIKLVIQIAILAVICVIVNLNTVHIPHDREFDVLYMQSAAIFIAEVHYDKSLS